MGKLLLLVLIALAIYWLYRGLFRAQVKPPPEADPRRAEGETMVTCARCGVNMPRSEARAEADRWVCLANPHCR